MSPSRVSQNLRSLETKLGARLVQRTSRSVSLTPAGERLERELRPAIEELDSVLARATGSARGLAGTLRVGLLSGPAAGPHLMNIIKAFEAEHPECRVELIQEAWDDPVRQLRQGEVDVMATWVPLDHPDIAIGPTLSLQRRALAVARDHPLASRESVDVEELADYPVGHIDGWPRELREAMTPSETSSGRPIRGPRIGTGDQAILELPLRIARGELVLPTVESAPSYMGGAELAFVPIRGLLALRSALASFRRSPGQKVRALLGVAERCSPGAAPKVSA